MRNLALADLTAEDLASMLSENEREPDGWRPVRAAQMTDRVRECLKAHAARGSPPDRRTQPRVPRDAPGVLLGDLRHLQEQQEGTS
jgi:hypothetical protein